MNTNIAKIFEPGKLDEKMVIAKIATTTQRGKEIDEIKICS